LIPAIQMISYCTPGFSEDTDVVYFRPGRGPGGSDTLPAADSRTTIRIVRETPEDVVVQFTTTRSTITFSRKYVEAVDYFDAPDEYNRALKAVRDRKPDSALQHLSKINPAGGRRWLAEHKLFYLAKTHLLMGETKRKENEIALKLFNEFSSRYPDTRFKWEALIGGVAALFQMRDYGATLEMIEKIEASTPSNSRGEHMAEFWRAKVYEVGRKDYERARKSYSRLATMAATGSPDISILAGIGELRCLKLQGRHDAALRRARNLVRKGGIANPVFLAHVWSMIGDCLLASGTNPAQSNDALMAYLRVVVAYNRDPRLTARAAYKAAECFETAQRMDRAAELYRRAAKTRRGGEWSRKAAARLKQMG
jgi:tetratricopeptide (TPR) repeat protein